MARKGGTQSEATRRATRRNYALYQAMGMAALTEQVRRLCVDLGGEGYGDVHDACDEAAIALEKLAAAVEEWDPNK